MTKFSHPLQPELCPSISNFFNSPPVLNFDGFRRGGGGGAKNALAVLKIALGVSPQLGDPRQTGVLHKEENVALQSG
jgi:hypothetical protein